MDSKSRTLAGKTPLPGKATLPPAWQLNELQKDFIEDLWLPEEDVKGTCELTDNLATPG